LPKILFKIEKKKIRKPEPNEKISNQIEQPIIDQTDLNSQYPSVFMERKDVESYQDELFSGPQNLEMSHNYQSLLMN
jgi:hypothetical protein